MVEPTTGLYPALPSPCKILGWLIPPSHALPFLAQKAKKTKKENTFPSNFPTATMGANYSVQNPYARKYCSPATIKCAEPVSGNVVIPCNSCQPRCDKTVYEWRNSNVRCTAPSAQAATYPTGTTNRGNLLAFPFQSVGQGATTQPFTCVASFPTTCTKSSSAVDSALGLVAAASKASVDDNRSSAPNASSTFERLFRENGG